MKNVVVGIVESRAQAETIVGTLQTLGFPVTDISALFPTHVGTEAFAKEQHTSTPHGAEVGAGSTGIVAGAIGVLAGVGALTIPGVGVFMAVGPLIAGFSGILGGAAVGGLSEALVGMGVPEVDAKTYEKKLKAGNILVSIHTADDDERGRAVAVLEQMGAKDVSTRPEPPLSARGSRPTRRQSQPFTGGGQ
jgi:hypothetical protein